MNIQFKTVVDSSLLQRSESSLPALESWIQGEKISNEKVMLL